MSVRKSPKIQKLVVNAIRKLQDVQGSTPREITNYISQEYDVPSAKIQRQVGLALARAVSYGILQRSKGGYYACNRDCLSSLQQMEEGELTDKCGCAPRGRAKRARSRKSQRRKRAAGSCGRKARRAGGRRTRKRSRRGRGKSGGGGGRRRRRRGTSGGGKKSRRRRGRGSKGHKSRRRGRRSRRGRAGGKQCPTGGNNDGGTGSLDDLDVYESRGGRRARSASATRNRNRSGSSHSGSFDDERLDDKASIHIQPIESPETLND